MKRNKGDQRPIEIAAEKASTVLGVASRAESMARRLLRRTRQVSRRLPMVPAGDSATMTDGHIMLALPELPSREDELARQLAALHARAERAEQAAAWLRARLRAERARRTRTPPPDIAALSADLTRELTRLHAPHPDAVRRVVMRTLAAHGMPVSPATAPASPAHPSATPYSSATAHSAWPREKQDILAKQVLARAPEVADPSYVHRIAALLEERGRLTLPQVTRATGFDSAMARRRLRLALEALTALGALTLQDGSYSLNTAYQPSPHKRKAPTHRRESAQREGQPSRLPGAATRDRNTQDMRDD